MLVCENCGAQSPAGSRFCVVCGAALPAAATQAMPLPTPGPASSPAWLWPAIGAGVALLLAVLGGALWFASRNAATTVADATPSAAGTGGASATATRPTAARPTPRPTAAQPKATDEPVGAVAPPARTALSTDPPAPADAPLAATAPPASPTSQAAALGPLGPQRPSRVSASDAAPDSVDSSGNTTSYQAANAADGQLDSAWRLPGNGVGAWLLFEFPAPLLVREVQILPGYAKVDPYNGVDRFTQNRRVRRVRLEFADGSSREATLAERAELQAVPVDDTLTTSVRVVVLETSSPSAVDGRDFTPIGEVVVIGQAQQ